MLKSHIHRKTGNCKTVGQLQQIQSQGTTNYQRKTMSFFYFIEIWLHLCWVECSESLLYQLSGMDLGVDGMDWGSEIPEYVLCYLSMLTRFRRLPRFSFIGHHLLLHVPDSPGLPGLVVQGTVVVDVGGPQPQANSGHEGGLGRVEEEQCNITL